MSQLRIIFYFTVVLIKLLRPGGVKALTAENIILRQQLISLGRCRKRAPKLTVFDRIMFGFLTAFINPKRLLKVAVIIKPATLLKFHQALVKHKYHLLFSNKTPKKPGPKGPGHEVINVILEMKQHNPRYGYRRIAMQIKNAFDIDIDKDVVRRVLAKYYKPSRNDTGHSWLTFIGHMKDSLWSVDLFRCESICLKTHWVMVIIDQYTRRIIGFATHVNAIDGIAICCMLNKIISKKVLPKYLSSDNDPLYTFHRWKANLRILGIKEIKSIPYVPMSHPFVERVIGIVRQEFLDQTLFWNTNDLDKKLEEFQHYYNEKRSHCAHDGTTPSQKANEKLSNVIKLKNYCWKSYCRGLFQLPIAA